MTPLLSLGDPWHPTAAEFGRAHNRAVVEAEGIETVTVQGICYRWRSGRFCGWHAADAGVKIDPWRKGPRTKPLEGASK